MMKKLLFNLLLIMAMAIGVSAQTVVQIGEGTTTTYVTPYNSLWGYSFVEQIFTAEEIGMPGTITSISFNLRESDASQTNTIDVFMKNVSRTSFSGTTDYETVVASDMVFSGSVTFSPGWSTITLDTPFEYDGVSNLMIGIHEYTSGYSSRYFYYTSTTNSVISFHSDSADPNPYSLGSYSGTVYVKNERANIMLEINEIQTSCARPTELVASNVGTRTVDLSWTNGADETNWQICINGDVDNLIDVTTNPYTLTGLTPETAYSIKVRANCGDEQSIWSNTVNITTLVSCNVPTDLEITDITTTSATVSWTAGASETLWNLEYKKNSDAEWTAVNGLTAGSYTLTSLDPSSVYSVRVQADCELEGTSQWLTESFATVCGVITSFPWTEDFESYSASSSGVTFSAPCWVNEHIEGAGAYFFEVYTGTMGDNNTNTLRLRDMTSGTMTKLMLPEMNFGGVAHQFVLDVFRNSSSANYTEGIRVFASADGEIDGATELAFISRSYLTADAEHGIPAEAASGWYTYELNIPITTGPCYIILRGESRYGSSTYMDNFVVRQAPSCIKPFALAVSNITARTATLTWTPIEGQTAWQICLNDDTDDVIDVTETTYTLIDLSPESDYTFKVRANCGEGDYSEWTANVSFTTGIACPVPTALAVSNITAHTATATWTAGAGETAWQVCLDGDEDAIIDVTEPTYAITDLYPESDYTIKVRANCGGIDGVSAWSSTVSYTTTEACPPPANLALAAYTSTSATLTWFAGEAESWLLMYGTDSGFGADTYTEVTVTEPTAELTGLTSETVYYARVMAYCGGDDESDWSSTLSFEPTAKVVIGSGTATNNYLPTYTFYNYTLSQQIYSADEIGTAGYINSIDFYNAGDVKTRNINVYLVSTDKTSFSNTTDWITVAADDMVFSGSVTFASNVWTSITFESVFYYSGTTNLAVVVDDNTGSYSSGLSCRVFDATSQALRIYSDGTNYNPESPSGYTGTVMNVKNQVRLLVVPGEPPSCLKPTALVTDTITGNGATISWTPGLDETSWMLKYGENGFDVETEGTEVMVETTPSYELTGLNPNTLYRVYIKSVCGDTDESEWATMTFRTECGPEAIPYSETFEDYTSGLPSCWTKLGSGTIAVQTGTVHLGTKSLKFSGATSNLVVLPELAAELNTLQVSLWTRPESFTTSSCGTFSVGYVTDITDESSFVAVQTYTYNSFSAYDKKTIYMNSAPAGSRLALRHNPTNTSWYWFVDDIDIDLLPSCIPPSALAVSDITTNSATIAWTAGADETAWQICVNEDMSDIIDVTENPFVLNNLGADSDYNVMVRANCAVDDQSSWTNAVNFTTLPTCLVPTALSSSNITAHSATITWTPSGDETAWQISVNGEEDDLIDVENTTYTLENLSSESTYSVRVRAYCSADDQSAWTSAINITTLISCPRPTALAATLTPGNGTIATLSWTENGTATDWTLEYGTAADFSGATSVSVEGTPSIDLTGLTAETTYYARVKTICDVDDESSWSTVINFTPTDAYSITLNEGTSTNSYVPVYGLWVDNYSRSQFIIPASDLTALQGASITKLTFYSSNTSINWGAAEFDVRLAEVDNTTVESLEAWDNLELAYHGSLGINGNLMEVTFDTPYTYMGGNLMVGTNETVSGTYSSCSWYGVTVNGASMGGYGTSISQRNFLPKVTINFIPGEISTTYTITASAGENGYITPNGEVTVTEGESQSFTITPNNGYIIASVIVDATQNVTSQLVNGVYTFNNVTADHTIAATFQRICTITATAGANGSIDPEGTIELVEGATQSFTITPDAGYQIETVIVDGNNVIGDVVNGVYTFTNVTANHTIHATFYAPIVNTYTIEATCGPNGSISPSGTITVNEGETVVVTLTPDAGYRIESVIVDGVDAMMDVIDMAYTFYNVRANHTINVTFTDGNAVDEYSSASMAIYPNPNNGMFSIDFSNIEGEATYQIIDARGAVVETSEINVTNGETKMFNHTLTAGTYFVRIINGDKIYVGQIVVE